MIACTFRLNALANEATHLILSHFDKKRINVAKTLWVVKLIAKKTMVKSYGKQLLQNLT